MYVCVCMYECMYVWMYVCVCMYVWMYVCMLCVHYWCNYIFAWCRNLNQSWGCYGNRERWVELMLKCCKFRSERRFRIVVCDPQLSSSLPLLSPFSSSILPSFSSFRSTTRGCKNLSNCDKKRRSAFRGKRWQGSLRLSSPSLTFIHNCLAHLSLPTGVRVEAGTPSGCFGKIQRSM